MPNQFPTASDVLSAMRNSKISLKLKELENGSVIQKGAKTILYSGGYSIVFPFKKTNGEKVAVRCWVADIGEAKKRSQILSTHLGKLNSKYFVGFKYVDSAILINGIFNPLIIMDWIDGQTLKHFLNENINDKSKIISVANKFKDMVHYFHEKNIAHGDLQHGNILIKKSGELVAIDYDSMYVEELKGLPDNVKGLPGYQHPARKKNKTISPKLDYFSESVIYISLLVYSEMPQLWNKYKDTNDLLFSMEDFSNPNQSEIFKTLSKSNNKLIVDLTNKMKDSLNETSIDNLCCLEENLIDKKKVAMQNIFDKFEKQPNPPNYKPVFPPINDILSKF
jgi:serine/threonine protein kinase